MQRIVLATILVLVVSAPAGAVTYYVAPVGSDSANGLTPGTAWATLQKAADTVAAGDTVHVADGNYVGFDLRTPGTAADPIAFLADGANVRITADNDSTPDGINIEDSAYATVDGFIVNNRTRAGIRAAVSDHITIRNCSCGNNGRWGIFTGYVDDLLVENNETYGSVLEHGIYASNSADRPVIRGNHSHDNHANGIHMNGDASLPGDGTISNALVEDNIIHGNGAGGGSGINMDGVINSVVRNNLLYDNHSSGISLYQIDGATGSTGNLVINNTIINASNSRWCINIKNGSTGITLRNNILYNDHPTHGVIAIDADSAPGFSSDYNSLMSRFSIDGDETVISFAAWQAEGYDANSFLATPADHFVNPASDFHLLNSSPAIDTGTSINAPGNDIEGGGRPVGSGYDIGAYEAQLPNCGDNNVDPGEICGEPGLPACADPCTACLGCVCAPSDPVCGDAAVCGSEQCESDGDCGGGLVCQDCACVNPPLCTSGIPLENVRLKSRATTFTLKFSAEALIPKPWTGVDPAVAGIHFRLDSTTGTGVVDTLLAGGAMWTTNATGTNWTYADPAGTVAGITKAVVRDLSNIEDGRLRVRMKGKSTATATLPDATAVRNEVVFGDSDECGSLAWNGPGQESPACEGSPALLSCK